MSAKINKNGKEYPIGVIPQNEISKIEEMYANHHLTSTSDTLVVNTDYVTRSDGILRIYIASGNIAFSLDGVVSFLYSGAQTSALSVKKGQTIKATTLDGSNSLKFYPYSVG